MTILGTIDADAALGSMTASRPGAVLYMTAGKILGGSALTALLLGGASAMPGCQASGTAADVASPAPQDASLNELLSGVAALDAMCQAGKEVRADVAISDAEKADETFRRMDGLSLEGEAHEVIVALRTVRNCSRYQSLRVGAKAMGLPDWSCSELERIFACDPRTDSGVSVQALAGTHEARS